MLITDPSKELTWSTLYAAKSTTNNATGTTLDMKGYQGRIAVRVNVGIMTAGDTLSSARINLQASADGNVSNATNLSTSTYHDSTTNNTANSGTLVVDPRAELRYLHVRAVMTGANTPAFPLSVSAAGVQQVQP